MRIDAQHPYRSLAHRISVVALTHNRAQEVMRPPRFRPRNRLYGLAGSASSSVACATAA